MQLKTLQIVWHSKEPVFSVDFLPSTHSIVTGGQDGELKVGMRSRAVHTNGGAPCTPANVLDLTLVSLLACCSIGKCSATRKVPPPCAF